MAFRYDIINRMLITFMNSHYYAYKFAPLISISILKYFIKLYSNAFQKWVHLYFHDLKTIVIFLDTEKEIGISFYFEFNIIQRMSLSIKVSWSMVVSYIQRTILIIFVILYQQNTFSSPWNMSFIPSIRYFFFTPKD